MKNYTKMSLALFLSVAVSGLLLVAPSTALASGNSASSLAAGVNVKSRQNNAVSMAAPLSNAAKGVKVFGMDTAATLVSDEKAVVPTAGALASIEIGVIGSGGIGQALPVCYAMVFDSSVAADTTEAGSVSRMLVPPLMAGLSVVKQYEFAYPKQFHKGLVVLMGGAGAANCRASIGWLRVGGAD